MAKRCCMPNIVFQLKLSDKGDGKDNISERSVFLNGQRKKKKSLFMLLAFTVVISVLFLF